jgi:predicted dehydrogenase
MNLKNENIPEKESSSRFTRRQILKGLASLPVLGLFAQQFLKKMDYDSGRRAQILSELNLNGPVQWTSSPISDKLIRVGIIGFGVRGEEQARALGFAHPDWLEQLRINAQKNKLDTRLQDWLNQENLQVAITGICEVFDQRRERGLEVAQNKIGPSSAAPSLPVMVYQDYRKMLESRDIDAVIIATPDHHHAQITIDAVKAGKHVYCEKCFTRTVDELYQVREAVKTSGQVFQLGHQYHQNASFTKAREVIEKNILGKITLVEVTTNRNTPDGAWIRHLDTQGNPKPGNMHTINWDLWLGSRPKVPFSIDRYYNWTKWWDYATGLSGQLLSHEYDAVNQLLGLGIPATVTASGGIYYFKDNREIPDIFHAVFEFPEKDITLMYSASLANSRFRSRVLMGHDASMELGDDLKVTVDDDSTRFKEKIKSGLIDTSAPLFTYRPGASGIDAVTTASEKFYASRGLIYTYRDGRRVDTTHLHVREWLEGIRSGSKLSCGIDKAFEVTLACHMATTSYREGRTVKWNPQKQLIV